MLCRIPFTLFRVGGARRLAPFRPVMGNVVIPVMGNVIITNFHSTSHLWAKSKHGKKGKVSDDNDDDSEEEETDSKKQKKGRKSSGGDGDSIEIPDMKSRETTMEGRIDRLNQELSKIRAGRASADMFNHIVVEINGSKVSLPELCQVTMKTSSKVSIAVFDPTLVSKVSTGILECGLGLNPSVDGNTVVVDVPKPSKEARDSLVKAAQKIAEKVGHCNVLINKIYCTF